MVANSRLGNSWRFGDLGGQILDSGQTTVGLVARIHPVDQPFSPEALIAIVCRSVVILRDAPDWMLATQLDNHNGRLL